MKPIVNLVVLGKGNVGSAWLSLFLAQQQLNKKHADLRLVALANSKKALVIEQGIDNRELDKFEQLASVTDLDSLVQQLASLKLDNVVVVDLTASERVANLYLDFATLGWHIVSANKLPLTVANERYQKLVETLTQNKSFWGINATVGAALPVQNSLSDLLQAGDTLKSIEGVFSGSLCYLLASYQGKESFTDLVKSACEQGFTEPDPREDLSGSDVQRKLLILARLTGLKLNLSDIKVEPLLPEELLQGSLQDFWQNKAAIDDYMQQAFNKAQAQGHKLAYAAQARIFNKVVEANVGLVAKSSQSALTQLTPLDNVFTLITDFYSENPLVIRGPGAGAIITATAVNIDINKFITQLAVVAEQAS